MDKRDVINAIAHEAGISKADAKSAMDAFLRVITAALASGEKVQIVGFGAFESKKRAPRVGRNPGANVSVDIPARYVPVFKPGSTLKTAVAKGR